MEPELKIKFYNIDSKECSKIKWLFDDNFKNLNFNDKFTSDKLTNKVTEVAITAMCLCWTWSYFISIP